MGYTGLRLFRKVDNDKQAISFGIKVSLKRERLKDNVSEKIGNWAFATGFVHKISMPASESSPVANLL